MAMEEGKNGDGGAGKSGGDGRGRSRGEGVHGGGGWGAPACLHPGRRGWSCGRGGLTQHRGEGPPPGLDLPRGGQALRGPRTPLPLAGGVGRRVPVTTSPRLELELSPDLLDGRSAERGLGGGGGGARVGWGGRGGGRGRAAPRAQAVLPHLLLLQQPHVLQLDGAGDEAHLAALLHQPPDPPVVVVLLRQRRARETPEAPPCQTPRPQRCRPPRPAPTSLMCRKSLGSKQMAMPCTGTSSLADGL